MTTSPSPEGPAGFWIRGGAYAIDGLVSFVVIGAAGLALSVVGIPGSAVTVFKFAGSMAYFTCLPVLNGGQTPGKMAAGIALIRDDGSTLSYLHCFLRWLGYMVSSVVLGLGFIMAAFTGRKRALHDFIAGTRVVSLHPIPLWRKVLVIALGLLLPLALVLGIAAALAIPKFSNMQKKAKEAATKGHLGALRSGLSIFYGDAEGKYPASVPGLPRPGLAFDTTARVSLYFSSRRPSGKPRA